jgi:hypothetical protein
LPLSLCPSQSHQTNANLLQGCQVRCHL